MARYPILFLEQLIPRLSQLASENLVSEGLSAVRGPHCAFQTLNTHTLGSQASSVLMGTHANQPGYWISSRPYVPTERHNQLHVQRLNTISKQLWKERLVHRRENKLHDPALNSSIKMLPIDISLLGIYLTERHT